jgi:hypothetical protein
VYQYCVPKSSRHRSTHLRNTGLESVLSSSAHRSSNHHSTHHCPLKSGSPRFAQRTIEPRRSSVTRDLNSPEMNRALERLAAERKRHAQASAFQIKVGPSATASGDGFITPVSRAKHATARSAKAFPCRRSHETADACESHGLTRFGAGVVESGLRAFALRF